MRMHSFKWEVQRLIRKSCFDLLCLKFKRTPTGHATSKIKMQHNATQPKSGQKQPQNWHFLLQKSNSDFFRSLFDVRSKNMSIAGKQDMSPSSSSLHLSKCINKITYTIQRTRLDYSSCFKNAGEMAFESWWGFMGQLWQFYEKLYIEEELLLIFYLLI